MMYYLNVLSKFCCIVLVSFLVGSCATTTQEAEGMGFGTTNIRFCKDDPRCKDMAIITFRKYPYVPEWIAEDYILYRCAQVTIENGRDYFKVLLVSSSALGVNIFNKLEYQQFLYNPFTRYDALQSAPLKPKSFCQTPRCYIPNLRFKPGMDKVFVVIKVYWNPVEAGPCALNAEEIMAYLQPDRF